MRVLMVVVSGLGAIVLGVWAYGQQSIPLAAASGLCLVVLAISLTGRRRHEGAPAGATAPAAQTPRVSQPMAAVPSTPAATIAATTTEPPLGARMPSGAAAAVAARPELLTDAVPAYDEIRELPTSVPEEESSVSPQIELEESPSRDTPVVRTPFSVQPTVVLMSLFDAAAERYDTLATHLWLLDEPTRTLRLIAAFGPRVPTGALVSLDAPALGPAATAGAAQFARLDDAAPHDAEASMWRYAVPVGTPEMRGVAAVDIASRDETPSPSTLNDIAAVLRGSLTAAVAIHVAHAEMETAVQLLNAAQELATGTDRELLLTSALERAMAVADATTGSVMLPDPATGALRIVAAKGLPDEVVRQTSVRAGDGIAGVVYESGSPLLVEDLPGHPGTRRHGVLSSASVPIADSEGSLGVINVGSRIFPARLTDAYLRALGILGSQTALALRTTEAIERSWDTYLENLQALATALEANDPYRAGASQRTADLAVAVGHAMEMRPEDIVSLRIAAILHDVGMGLATGSIGSSDRPLTTIDRGLVRSHPKVASDVMSSVPSLERLAPIVRHHHERYDGTGYDTGLSGESIPLGSRILAVVDAYVSMTSPRPYRDAMTCQDALAELDAMAGSQFDPHVVAAFHGVAHDRPELTFGL